jgi:hypothetical protein
VIEVLHERDHRMPHEIMMVAGTRYLRVNIGNTARDVSTSPGPLSTPNPCLIATVVRPRSDNVSGLSVTVFTGNANACGAGARC